MELLSQPGGHIFVAEAPIWDRSNESLIRNGDHLLLGVTKETIKLGATRGMSVYLGQLYGVVAPGLIFTTHLFEGLKRGMLVGDDSNADKHKLVASWAQHQDAYLEGHRNDPTLKFRDGPKNRVFVVVISRNKMLDEFPQIYGWMEHWTWVAADPSEAGAPVDWDTRFDRRIWSAPQAG